MYFSRHGPSCKQDFLPEKDTLAGERGDGGLCFDKASTVSGWEVEISSFVRRLRVLRPLVLIIEPPVGGYLKQDENGLDRGEGGGGMVGRHRVR